MEAMQEPPQAVILAGGRGTRLSERTNVIPKPMVTVGGDPLLIHIMRHFHRNGVRDFIICGGYKCDVIKRFFSEYPLRMARITEYANGSATPRIVDGGAEDWTVRILDTGIEASTADRLLAARSLLRPGRPFWLTYGDTISDVPLDEVRRVHGESPAGTVATLTVVPYSERFGVVTLEDRTGVVSSFHEKSTSRSEFINGGFMLCEPSLFDHIPDEPGADLSFIVLSRLAPKGMLTAYVHDGYWKACDTQNDLDQLNADYRRHPEHFAAPSRRPR